MTSSGAALKVNVPASIVSPPASLVVGEGDVATFSVVATGSDLVYQWFKGDQGIPGANSPTFTIAQVNASDAGNYSVVVSNNFQTVSSPTVTLTVRREAPAITSQPASQNIPVGGNVTFTVVATGTTLQYQWRRSNTNIPNATTGTLTLNGVTLQDAGEYSVAVTNSLNSIASEVAILNVGYAPVIAQPPLALASFPGGSATFSCTVTGSPPIFLQWLLNGAPLANQTNATLSLTNVQSVDFGVYALAASNLFGAEIGRAHV